MPCSGDVHARGIETYSVEFPKADLSALQGMCVARGVDSGVEKGDAACLGSSRLRNPLGPLELGRFAPFASATSEHEHHSNMLHSL